MVSNLNSELKKYFTSRKNIGQADNPNAVGELVSKENNNFIKFSANIEKNIIKDIKFKAFGCKYTIAGASYFATQVKNKDILTATLFTEKDLEKKLGEFPQEKKKVLNLIIYSFQKLITNYISNTEISDIYKTNNKKIAVAISGGVDSAIAIKILRDEGWDIFGITMKLPSDNSNYKNNYEASYVSEDIKTARKIAMLLKIPHIVIDIRKQFEKIIIEPFCINYLKGKTPNPCIDCNKYIKFGLLLKLAKTLGANYIATGHYCRTGKSSKTDLYEIKKGVDASKDQSYFLWKLSQDQILHIKTPLGVFKKIDIKKKAEMLYPFLSRKNESQETCFITENNYHDFLTQKFKNIKRGKVFNTKGELLGTHKGFPFYTIGQRKGLEISYNKPIYIKEIIPEKNIIIVSDESGLYQKEFKVFQLNFISGYPPGEFFNAIVKIRYNSDGSSAKIKILDKKSANITFDKPQKAITPGQSAVFYIKDTLIGGGIIFKYRD